MCFVTAKFSCFVAIFLYIQIKSRGWNSYFSIYVPLIHMRYSLDLALSRFVFTFCHVIHLNIITYFCFLFFLFTFSIPTKRHLIWSNIMFMDKFIYLYTSTWQQIKVCDTCGDVGKEDLLACCKKCTEGAHHT